MEKSVTRQRNEIPNIFQYANNKRKENLFNDVIIKVGNNYFPANRLVLSCCSEVFEKIFLSEMKEKYENEVEVKDVEANAMNKIIDFMYTGTVTFDDETGTMNLLSAAEYLQLNELKEFCSEYLESVISCDNCVIIMKSADLYRCDKLKEKSNQFISSNFEQISVTLDFKNLSKQDLKSCLSNLDKSLALETSMYEALIAWIKHDEQSRQAEVDDFLQLVNFSKFSFDYLNDKVLSERLVIDSKQSCSIFIKSLAEVNKRNQMKLFGKKIVSIGGYTTEKKVLEMFNLFQTTPLQYPDLLLPTTRHCSVRVCDVIYCVGGCNLEQSELYNQVWKLALNEPNLKWEKAAQMSRKRYSFAAAQFQNHIVISGGCNTTNCFDSTEVYTVAFDEWRLISSHQTSRYYHCLVECNGSLFAIGGFGDKNETLSSVERLTGLKNQWRYVKPMQTARKCFAAVSLNGFIYAIAGSNNSNEIVKSVEKYDSSADEWSYVQDLNLCRFNHAACVLQNKIYVVGGLNDEYKYVKEIECFNPKTNKWEITGKTEHKSFAHSLVVV